MPLNKETDKAVTLNKEIKPNQFITAVLKVLSLSKILDLLYISHLCMGHNCSEIKTEI